MNKKSPRTSSAWYKYILCTCRTAHHHLTRLPCSVPSDPVCDVQDELGALCFWCGGVEGQVTVPGDGTGWPAFMLKGHGAKNRPSKAPWIFKYPLNIQHTLESRIRMLLFFFSLECSAVKKRAPPQIRQKELSAHHRVWLHFYTKWEH